MTKKILAALIVLVVLTAVFWKPKPKPLSEEKEVIAAAEPKPSTEDNALSAASTDLSVVIGRRNLKPVVNIVALFPLSGENAAVGSSLKNSFLLAKKDLRYLQDSKYRYRFIADDGQDIAKAYEKQKIENKTDVIISFGTDDGNTISPLAEKDKVIHINFGSDNKKIAQGKYNFIIWTMPEQKIERLIDFYKEKGWKNIAFIGTDEDQETAVQNQAEKQGIKMTPFRITPEETDLLSLLQKSKDAQADAYLIQAKKLDDAESFLRQYKNAGITAPLTMLEPFAVMPDSSLSEGVCYTEAAQSMDMFNDRVKYDYPDTTSNYALGTVYDVVTLLVQTFEEAEKPEQAVNLLANTEEFSGVIGPVMQKEEGIFDSRAVLKCIVNGKPEIIYDAHAEHSH